MEISMLPGCVVTVTQINGPPTPFAYLCVANLTDARATSKNTFGASQSGPDRADPETFRRRGCILRGAGMVIDAVQCPKAEAAGIPCSDQCNPSLSFV
jgi:hypothetical protein